MKFGFVERNQKLAKFDSGKPFDDKLVELSRKIKKWHKKRLLFLIAVTMCYIKKKKKIKI